MENWSGTTQAHILRLIYAQDGISRSDIAEQLHLSMPTVLQHLRCLQAAGLIRESGKYASSSGRKAGILRGIPGVRVAVGCELQPNGLVLSLLDLSGSELNHDFVPLPLRADGDFCASVHSAVMDFIARADVKEGSLLGIGFALPAPIHFAEDYTELYLPSGHKSLPLSLLRNQFDFPSAFLRTSDAGALAEFRFFGKNENLFYVSFNQSLSGTFFQNGKIYRGDRGLSNRIGHITLVPGGEPCYCQKKGCAVIYCSSNRLSSIAPHHDLDEFFDMLHAGSEPARIRFQDYLEKMALLINNIHYIYDCSIIVGGEIGCRIQEELPRLRALVEEIDPNCHGASYIRPCHYSRRINSIGAAYNIIAKFFEMYDAA